MPRLEFWYEFASTYSYLSAMRIEAAAAQAGVELVWRPFLLGPIFQAQNWPTSPFNIYPAKGRYMVRDLERISAERGLVFRMPAVFPAASLLACRIAVAGEPHGWTPAFSKAVYEAEFVAGRDISDRAELSAVLQSLGVDSAAALSAAETDATKARLRARNAEAASRGIFGAPSFTTNTGELFWGDDRLEQAMCWARR